MNTILVTGSNGQLGSELKDLKSLYPNDQFIFTDVEELDICNHKDVEEFIVQNKIDIIINCAAYTAVDKAENEYELNDKINHLAVRNFAEISSEKGIKFVQVSTDYVFDGENHRPYVESDTTNPQSVYGRTKLDGELAMLKLNPKNSIIIRTSWVYSSYGNNFVKTMLRLGAERDELGVIFDQIGTPTYAKDLAKVILEILPQLNNDEVEIYHFSNLGACSWFDFSKAIFDISNINVKINPIETKQYPTPAKRPFYSIMNKSKIVNKFNLEIPYWRDSLEKCIEKLSLIKK